MPDTERRDALQPQADLGMPAIVPEPRESWLTQSRELPWSAVSPIVEQINTLASQWQIIVTKDFALAQVITHQYHHALQKLLNLVQMRIGDFAFHFRGSNSRKEPGFEQYNRLAVTRHCTLLGWLIQQPEWEDHHHGLDVDAELPDEYYQELLPAYLNHDWQTQPRKANPRRIDPEVLALNWDVPLPPETSTLR